MVRTLDTLIAAHAASLATILATNNTREFERAEPPNGILDGREIIPHK